MELSSNHISYYQILKVSPNASLEEIKKSYRQKLLETHPDKQQSNNSNSTIQIIQLAYKTLSNIESREIYDKSLHDHFIKTGLVNTGNSNGIDIDGLDIIDLSQFNENDNGEFKHNCPRCTSIDSMIINENDLLDNLQNEDISTILVQCLHCSLWIGVTYSIIE